MAVLAAMLLLAGVVHLGCSETTKYRVLSFFFDGVPPPAGQAADEGPEDETAAAKKDAEPGKRISITSHTPFKNGQCSYCHSAESSMEGGIFGADLCRKCHAGHFYVEATDWSHGPAAAGDCLFCHAGHESPNRALLRAPQRDLCLRCHETSLLDEPYHADIGEQDCSTCHDPHFSGNRLLLADSRTYKRSITAREAVQSRHAPWREHECSACHIVEESNRLKEDLEGACRKCHEEALSIVPAEATHAPVSQGKCLLCHVPHESSKRHLLGLAGEDLCFKCHEPEQISGPSHPRIDSVDCLLCHAGHWSHRGALLKPGIPSENWPESATSQPAWPPAHDQQSEVDADGEEEK